MLPKFFLVTSIYVGTMSFHFRNISPWKIFHRYRQRHSHQSPTNFLNFGYWSEINIFRAEILNWGIFFQNIYESLGTKAYFFKRKKIDFLFFDIFYEFLKKNLIFWKNYAIILPLTEQNFTTWSGFLTIFHKDPIYLPLWKIVECSENCTQWSV